jgi:hypothetical protein
MKFMIIVKASPESEAGKMPSEALLAEMGKGLHPSSRGARVRFSGKNRTVVDGPFGPPSELIAGFWLIQVKSKEEAIEWVKRCPNPMESDSEIEIRQVFSAEDFGAEFTPELREQEEKLRQQIEAQQQQ